MPLSVAFFIDAGNAFTKWTIGQNEGVFVHAIAELTRSEWEYATARFGRTSPLDLIRIGDRYYAVGETAENYNVTKKIGRPKYKREYYGVLFASAVARAFVANPDALSSGLDVYASHATDDFDFRSSLIKSVLGKWSFECADRKFSFETKSVKTFEEAFGGYCRRAVHYNGRSWEFPLEGLSTGVIDIGGGTCGVIGVNERGVLQPAMAKSGSIGILNAIERFKKELFRKYKSQFAEVQRMPEERVRNALATGVFRGFGLELDCKRESEIALSPLMNEVGSLWTTYLNGGAGLDVVILTGGGNGIVSERTMEIIGRDNSRGAILSDQSSEIHFANVRGARDFADVAESL